MDDPGPAHVELTVEEIAPINLGRGCAARTQILAILVPKGLLHRSMLFWVEHPDFGLRLWIVGHAPH